MHLHSYVMATRSIGIYLDVMFDSIIVILFYFNVSKMVPCHCSLLTPSLYTRMANVGAIV